MNALRADAPQASKPSIRAATIDDLDALLQLETASFDADGLSRRSYRKFLHRSTATILVAERRGILVGALVLLFRRSSAIARLYSLAVAQESRGHGVGRALLGAAKQAALGRDCAVLRLEVRVDNDAARSLYESNCCRTSSRRSSTGASACSTANRCSPHATSCATSTGRY